jgi:hypothetical protein
MEQKQAIADRLKQSNNILVTVSSNPSVDQLSACIGLTLALNKMGKHATAVFSGIVPSTIEFLQPEKTIEKNTDSLRDFIIALDKAKADKLRYKVEDRVVKIFITPYKTSISEKDLDFSQGDFNVDVVVALGVHQQTELDQAITAHGRILHDAVVTTINTQQGGELGSVNWVEPNASSLSELVVQIVDGIDKTIVDGQMATAFLTGIVAETERFSNEKTTPNTMSISAELMAAGANQQLVATKLEEPVAPPPPPPSAPATPVAEQGAKLQGEHGAPEAHESDDGTLEIGHEERHDDGGDKPADSGGQGDSDHHEDHPEERHDEPAPEPERHEEEPAQIRIDEHGALQNMQPMEDGLPPLPPLPPKPTPQDDQNGSTDPTKHMKSSHMILQPPAMGGGMAMSAAGMPDDERSTDPLSDPLSLPQPDGAGFGMGGQGSFGPPPASANIAPPAMPYLPPSMTPGGSVTPAEPALAPAAPAIPEPAADEPPEIPPPVGPPQIIQPGAPAMATTPQAAAPAPLFAPAAPAPTPAPATPPAPAGETLSQIEADVNSPHLQQQPAPVAAPALPAAPAPPPAAPAPVPVPAPVAAAAPAPAPTPAPATPPAPAADLASARDAVMAAINAQPGQAAAPEPIQALNAQPLGVPLHEGAAPAAPSLDATANPTFTLPDAPAGTLNPAPPATPPPMMPQSGFPQQ